LRWDLAPSRYDANACSANAAKRNDDARDADR
jgi:hypothetical protein